MIVNGEKIEFEEMEIMAILLDRLGGKVTFSANEIIHLHYNVEGATLSNNSGGAFVFELKYKPEATLKENGIDLSKV